MAHGAYPTRGSLGLYQVQNLCVSAEKNRSELRSCLIVEITVESGSKATRVLPLSEELYPVSINKSRIVSIFYHLTLSSLVCFVRREMYLSCS